jgi:hypothetical protein
MEQECRDGLTYPAMMALVNDFLGKAPGSFGFCWTVFTGFRRQNATPRAPRTRGGWMDFETTPQGRVGYDVSPTGAVNGRTPGPHAKGDIPPTRQ